MRKRNMLPIPNRDKFNDIYGTELAKTKLHILENTVFVNFRTQTI